MSEPRNPMLSPSESVLDKFEGTDRVAMLVLNGDFAETIERITSAEKAASPEFQAWLAQHREPLRNCETLLTQLTDVPTPGPTPRQLQGGLVHIVPTKEAHDSREMG